MSKDIEEMRALVKGLNKIIDEMGLDKTGAAVLGFLVATEASKEEIMEILVSYKESTASEGV